MVSRTAFIRLFPGLPSAVRKIPGYLCTALGFISLSPLSLDDRHSGKKVILLILCAVGFTSLLLLELSPDVGKGKIVEGSKHKHQCQIWRSSPPTNFHAVPLRGERVTNWCGFTAPFLIDTFFFEESRHQGSRIRCVNGKCYCYPLHQMIRALLESVALKLSLLQLTLFFRSLAFCLKN